MMRRMNGATNANGRVGRAILAGMVCAGWMLLASGASAAPIVEIDLDPTTPGVQSSLDVELGTFADIDVVISMVEPGAPLNGFELDVLYDPTIVSGTAATSGSFLLAPNFEIQAIAGPAMTEVAQVTLLPLGAVGSGALASFRVSTLAIGSTSVVLSNVILSAPFGVRIDPDAIRGGTLRVIEAGAPIPEPTAALLFGAGLVVAGAVSPRRRRPAGP